MPGPPKALVIAGGMLEAHRLSGLGARACPLVPIANRPLIDYVLDGLRAAGVREVAVLGDGATRAEVASVVGEGDAAFAIRYIDHVDERALDTTALVVQPADALLSTPFGGALDDVATDRLDAAVLRIDTPGPRAGACVLNAAAAAPLAGSREVALDGLADALVASAQRVRVDEVHGCLACRDDDEGLLRANRLALEALAGNGSAPPDIGNLLDSEIQGPAVIHPTARLRSALVRGPAVIGANVQLDDVYVGPYTAIGDDVVIEGAEIEHSLVLSGAEVRYPGVRLTTSIVGPRARLVRDFHLPRGMRVDVGADAVVALS
jgi:glucose-1-phosphate thymidylyltransferase